MAKYEKVAMHYEFYDEFCRFICSCDCSDVDLRETIAELRSEGYTIQ